MRVLLIKGVVGICRSRNVVTNVNWPTPIGSIVIDIKVSFQVMAMVMAPNPGVLLGFVVMCTSASHEHSCD